MEAGPIIIETPKYEEEKFAFCLEKDNEIFNWKLKEINKNSIKLILYPSNSKELNEYEKELSLINLKNINKNFYIYEKIEEFEDDLINYINQKQLKIKEIKDNEIILQLKIIGIRDNLVDIKLDKKEINEKDKINIIFKEIKKLSSLEEIKIIINELKEEIKLKDEMIIKNSNLIKELKEEIKLKDNRLSLLEKRIENIEKRLNEKENLEKKNNENKFDSKLCSLKDIDFIINYLKTTEMFKNKNFNFILLYRASIDGDNTANVHKKCCDFKNVIYFMKSEQGNIFGGFSEIGWKTGGEGNYKYPIDDNAFLFSLKNRKIYKSKKGKAKICWIGKEYGLCFDSSLSFRNYFYKCHNNIYSTIDNYFEGIKKEDLNEKFKFGLSELEVYRIE